MPIQSEIYRTIQYSDEQITESEIAAFCAICDQLNRSNICISCGPSRQAKYALTNFCRWSFVDGSHGIMTKKGFTPDADSRA